MNASSFPARLAVIAGDSLPACGVVWLAGGYPAPHAETLSRRLRLRTEGVHHVAPDRPVWAECGGMMVLFEELVTAQGRSHTMWGLLSGTVTRQARPAAIGPLAMELPGGCLRGRSFHHSRCDTSLQPAAPAVREGP